VHVRDKNKNEWKNYKLNDGKNIWKMIAFLLHENIYVLHESNMIIILYVQINVALQLNAESLYSFLSR
jgi:hypothetical protein